MKVYYQPTFTNVFILSSPFLYGAEHVETDNLSDITLEKGDAIIGFEYTNDDFPGVYILGYTYITGVGYTNDRDRDMVRFIFKDKPWLAEAIIDRRVALEALFNAYGIFAYKYVKDSMESTIAYSQDIIYGYSLRLKEYLEGLDKLPVINNKYRVIRNSRYFNHVKWADVTYIVICNGRNGCYLKIAGNRKEEIVQKIGLKHRLLGDYIYVYLPKEVQDVSIDAITDIIVK